MVGDGRSCYCVVFFLPKIFDERDEENLSEIE